MRHHVLVTAVFLSAFTVAALAAPPGKGAGMPFNLKATNQAFQKNPTGGIQQMTAKDPNDKGLIAAIRARLLQEAERFGDGDYSSITKGGGKPMPGTGYLRGIKHGQLAITYREVPAGAAVDYAGRDAATVDAIHKWIDAQIGSYD